MLQRVELLKEVTYTVCSEQLLFYDSLKDDENSKSAETYPTVEKKDIPTIAADDLQEYSENDTEDKDSEERDSKEKGPEDEDPEDGEEVCIS